MLAVIVWRPVARLPNITPPSTDVLVSVGSGATASLKYTGPRDAGNWIAGLIATWTPGSPCGSSVEYIDAHDLPTVVTSTLRRL